MQDILSREPGNAEPDPRAADMSLIDIVEETMPLTHHHGWTMEDWLNEDDAEYIHKSIVEQHDAKLDELRQLRVQVAELE